MLCAKFGWNCPSGSGEEDENVYDNANDDDDDDHNDDSGQRKNFDQKSSLEPSPQVSSKGKHSI